MKTGSEPPLPRKRSEGARRLVRSERRGRGFLWPENRYQAEGRAFPFLAMRDHTVRFHASRSLDLMYVDSDGERKRPVMIHRVVLGAIERFIGVLIEHYAGAFPLWLSPVQAVIMTITDRLTCVCQRVAEMLRIEGVRVEEDLRNEKIGFKIREARNQKIPYMKVIGEKEMEDRTIAVRKGVRNPPKLSLTQEFLSLFGTRCSGAA